LKLDWHQLSLFSSSHFSPYSEDIKILESMLPSCATKNYAGKKYPLKVKSERWAEVVNLLFQYASKLCNQKSCRKNAYALKVKSELRKGRSWKPPYSMY
jgi:hypothetical protein